MPTKDCDVIIIGGGPAGSTQACALAMHGLKVIVIDHMDPEITLQASFDGRTTAIAFGSSNIYRGIDLWPEFETFAEPILDIRISDDNSYKHMHYDHRELGHNPMGYILENLKMRQSLYNKARSFDNLEWIAPAKVIRFEQHNSYVTIELDNGRILSAALLIAADGRNSQMRDMLKITTVKWSYHQKAIVCMIGHELPHQGVAHEHFLPTGPFAVLPMQGNRSSVVWSIQEDLAPSLMALDDLSFAQAMQDKFGDSLGTLTLQSQKWCYPLGVQFATTYIDQRFAMIGDAAHVIHPIAGQGLNMGLRDVAALTECIVDAYRLGLDIGGHTPLERYQRWRRFDNISLIAVTDSLTRLFSNDIRPLKFIRDTGLGLMNNFTPAKKFLMKHAIGMVGNLPKLVAGSRV
ncbi:MAG: 2-octaprenyl-6-methoxyphenyl hydroxylase [Alphaproteobacteria bacterium]|nr:2-octaprenyl-6-methoxyphenyl hydroxylase [Alphaproteobacteria bacterium]